MDLLTEKPKHKSAHLLSSSDSSEDSTDDEVARTNKTNLEKSKNKAGKRKTPVNDESKLPAPKKSPAALQSQTSKSKNEKREKSILSDSDRDSDRESRKDRKELHDKNNEVS